LAKVVAAHEVGLPQGAGRVRVSSSRARRGKILAVEHPVFGWVGYREWALLGYVERLVERIGPLELVAWVGLTYQYAGFIKSAGDLAGWLNQVGGDVGDFFSQLGQGLFGGALPDVTAGVGAAFGGAGQSIQDALAGLTAGLGNQVYRYLWAAVAAAISVLALKRL